MTDPEVPVPEVIHRTPGQDIFNTGSVFHVPENPHVGHKADPDAFTRSKKKTYLRKIIRNNRKKGA